MQNWLNYCHEQKSEYITEAGAAGLVQANQFSQGEISRQLMGGD
jgi:hypothetical protein